MKRKIRTPFFVVNPKSYLYGAESLALALEADRLAEEYDVDIFFTAQAVDLRMIRSRTSRIILTAQHMDGLTPGKGMGHVLPEALKDGGVEAVFLNHAENPMTIHQLARAMARADQLDILTFVCADTVEEARALAMLHPDVMICEPTSLIGTGKVSGDDYMRSTNDAVRSVSGSTLVLQAAGISTGKNVYDAIRSGADGTGATSGIVAAADPVAALREMIIALARAREENSQEAKK